MMQWWRVTRHTIVLDESLVLVVNGLVAVVTSENWLIKPGDRWNAARVRLEAGANPFTCTMVSE